MVIRIVDTLTFLTLFVVLMLAYRPRKSWKHCILWMVVCCLLGHAGILLEEHIQWHHFLLYILNYALWGCIFSLIALKGQFVEKAVTALVYSSSFLYITDLSMLLAIFFHVPLSNPCWRFLYVPGFLIVGVFLWRYAIHTQRTMSRIYLWGIFYVSLLGIAVCYAYKQSPGSSREINALTSLFQMVLLYIVYYVFSVFIRYHEQNVNQVAVSSRNEAEETLLRETVRLNGELRAQRHEMNHHLGVLSALIAEGEQDKAQKLLARLTNAAPADCGSVHSGNVIADAILNQFIARAKEKGVLCQVDVCLHEQLPIRDVDLSSLLSNLLSNALEASVQVDHPQVDIHIYPTLRYLCFNIRNRANAALLRNNPDFQTTKEDPAAHGFGLRIIREIAARYDGRASFSVDGSGFFHSKVMLLMAQENASPEA